MCWCVCVSAWQKETIISMREVTPSGSYLWSGKVYSEGMNPMGRKESKHTHICRICRSRENGLYELNNLSRKGYTDIHIFFSFFFYFDFDVLGQSR